MLNFSNVTRNEIVDRDTDLYIAYNSTDRLDSLSNSFYGTSKYWWIILLANNIGSEFQINLGDIIRIPYPLDDVIDELSGE